MEKSKINIKMELRKTDQRIILTEDFVQDMVIRYLAEKGWSKSLKAANLREQGVDIKVKNDKYPRYWLIEVKGDPSKKVKSPEGSRSSSFDSAVGQITTRMHKNGKGMYKYGYKYGIAFSTYFCDMAIRKMPYDVMDKLNLYLFFVDKDGNVEELDWRKVKKIQKLEGKEKEGKKKKKSACGSRG